MCLCLCVFVCVCQSVSNLICSSFFLVNEKDLQLLEMRKNGESETHQKYQKRKKSLATLLIHLRSSSTCGWLLTCTCTCLTMLLLLVCIVHRITSLVELEAIVSTTVSPQVPGIPRCKYANGLTFSSPNETPSKDGASKLVRCLPNVFLIGSSKSGTTSLAAYFKNLSNISFVGRRVIPQDKVVQYN